MTYKADITDKRPLKSIFGVKKTANASPVDHLGGSACTDSTSAVDTRGILSRKNGIHNFGVALELLKSIGDGNEVLAPLKAVCGGLKVLVDTVEAIQRNDEDLRDLSIRLHRQLEALEQQDEMLSSSELNFVPKEVEYFVKSLRTYILDLNKVQKVLDALSSKEGGGAKTFFKKALMVYSVREEIKDCSRQLDGTFRLFMNFVTSFIAHQAVLLRNDVAEMQRRIDEKKVRDALGQLPCSDARGNQHDSCLEGTRENILKEVMDWASECSARPIFGLVDQAGTGKSTISIHMAQKWEKEGVSIGRFFFSIPNSVTDANDLPTTLARDMTNSGSSLRSLILEAINDHPNVTGHSIQEKLEWFVFTPLKQRRDGFAEGLDQVRKNMEEKVYSRGPENIHPEISEKLDIKRFEASYRQAMEQVRHESAGESCKEVLEKAHVAYTEALEIAYVHALALSPIIVIDALDECTAVDRGILLKALLGFLEEVSPVDSHPLKIFFTCRPEVDILSHIQEPRYNRLVHQADFKTRLEEGSFNDNDIALYANKYLEQVLSTAEIRLFVTRANGLFIWASTARAFLADAFDPSARFKDLISPNTKGSPLDSLYDEILRSVIDRIGRDQVKLLKKVLQGICVAREPLSTRTMDELLGLSNGVACRVVNMLRSVLSDETDGKAVQALHPTFIEYFRVRSQPGDLLFSDGEAEALLAVGCLDILSSSQLRFDICGVTRPDRPAPNNEDVEDLQQCLKENTTPGLRYAAVHGLSHAASSIGGTAVVTKLRDFFESNLLYWIELMSLLGRVYHLMQSVDYLKSRLEAVTAHARDLLTMTNNNWCEEIQELVQPFQAAIEKSGSQIYFSALPFAPSTGNISQFYHGRFRDIIPNVLHGAWRAHSRNTVLQGHTSAVSCLSFSPNGRKFASGSGDRTVRLWDVATGASLGEPLTGHVDGITCLSFSPDGRRLASGSKDSTVRLWDPATGAAIGEPLAGHTSGVPCLAFSPDGQRLASGSWDCTVQLCDVVTGIATGEPLTGHIDGVSCLALSSDGRRLASGSNGATVWLWDVATGASNGEPLTGHVDGVTCLSFSPDGRQLASGSKDSTVRLWDVATGGSSGEALTGHTEWIEGLAFSPDGRRLASGSTDSTALLWDAASGAAICEPLAGHASGVPCLAFSPDGQKVATGSWDRTIRLWDVVTGTLMGEPLTGHAYGITCLSFSPDGRRLASGSGDRTVRLWDVDTVTSNGESLTGHTLWITSLAFSPDGRRLASGSLDRTVRFWDVATGTCIGKPLTGHIDAVTYLSFSLDDRRLASGSQDGTVRLWDVETGVSIGKPLTGHTGWIACLAFSPDGRRLASGSQDCTVRLWDVSTGASICDPLTGHTDGVRCLTFSPDGRQLASGSWDKTYRLWDCATGASVGGPTRHDSVVLSLSFHLYDESLLLVVNDTSPIWKVSNGAPVLVHSEEQLLRVNISQSPPKFAAGWTHIPSSTNLHFTLPSSLQCSQFASHGGILAYGSTDGSVIILDCSHLI